MERREFIRQKVFQILNIEPIPFHDSGWCTNRISLIDTDYHDNLIGRVANILHWDYPRTQIKPLEFDAYIPGKYNCLLVYDDFYKFTSYRLKTLELYPTTLKLNFEIDRYKELCMKYCATAESYQKFKRRTDFDFIGGAASKRALLDVMIDVKPIHNGLNPTLRINVFDLPQGEDNNVVKGIERLIGKYLT